MKMFDFILSKLLLLNMTILKILGWKKPLWLYLFSLFSKHFKCTKFETTLECQSFVYYYLIFICSIWFKNKFKNGLINWLFSIFCNKIFCRFIIFKNDTWNYETENRSFQIIPQVFSIFAMIKLVTDCPNQTRCIWVFWLLIKITFWGILHANRQLHNNNNENTIFKLSVLLETQIITWMKQNDSPITFNWDNP